MEQLVRTPPLAYQVAETIRRHILEHGLSAGNQLPSEREFCERLGVSRNVVREALRALELAGVIEKHQGKGAFVRPFDPTPLARQMSFGLERNQSALVQLLEARVALERAAMSLVVRHATEEDLAELEHLVQTMEALERDGAPLMETDLAFHEALLHATHNEPLNRFSSVVREWMERSTAAVSAVASVPRERPARSMTELHRPIVEALRRGDVARAERLIDDHIELSALAALRTSPQDATESAG